MVKTEIIGLIKSLSGPEKRHFKLFCKKQSGGKAYMDLYDLINSQPVIDNPDDIIKKFLEAHPKKSFENTANYLSRLITDSLIILKIPKNKQFRQYFSLMRSQVLFERSVSEEGYKELKKAQQLAIDLQDNLGQFNGYRQELDYLSGLGFPEMTEKELVEMQLKVKENLTQLHEIQEHSFLFEQLQLRLTNSGRALTREEEIALDELLVRESGLFTFNKTFHFETEKNHLLFQSFFQRHTGHYKSSLESFKKLITLFEANERSRTSPPYQYLQILEGILDNLRMIKEFNQMEFFIKKIEKLIEIQHSERFKITAKQIICIYRLSALINTGEFSKAITLYRSVPDTLLKNGGLLNPERHAQLILHVCLTFFNLEDFKNANTQMNILRSLPRTKSASGVYRASCLLHILIHYELNNFPFLKYEMRSYSRKFKKSSELLKLEKVIFKVIRHNPRDKNKGKNLTLWNRIKTDLLDKGDGDFQRQILSYYDFNSWIKRKLKVF